MGRWAALKTSFNFAKAFWKNSRPSKRFRKSDIPEGYDYSDLDSWAAHADKSNKSSFAPKGYSPISDPKVDVFFLHPTTYFGKDNWNQPKNYYPAKEIVDEVIMPGQASVFNGACRIYAPYSRQATFYSFLAIRRGSARKALAIAYDDVKAAFEYYIEHLNQGRPFIIAGHSQGTLHTIRLLEECIENNDELLKRFIAAYAIGFQFPKDKFGSTFKHLKLSQSATDSKCIIAYDTYSYAGGPVHAIDRVEIWHKGDAWRKRAGHPVASVNPFTWDATRDKLDASHHLGGVHQVYQGSGISIDRWLSKGKIGLNAVELSAPIPNLISTELDEDGFLFINTPRPPVFRVAMLPNHNYHNYDYSLFYMNLRENIIHRVEAYLEQNAEFIYLK